jgi:hypothetical protein
MIENFTFSTKHAIYIFRVAANAFLKKSSVCKYAFYTYSMYHIEIHIFWRPEILNFRG